jgi:hypothetical protein
MTVRKEVVVPYFKALYWNFSAVVEKNKKSLGNTIVIRRLKPKTGSQKCECEIRV